MHRLRISSGKRSGESTPLDPSRSYIIGRGSEANLRFPEDPYMSRAHAQVLPTTGGWVVKNLSQHGFLVAGQHVKDERGLKPSDAMLIGNTLIVFELADPTVRRPDAFPAGGPVAAAPLSASAENARVVPLTVAAMPAPRLVPETIVARVQTADPLPPSAQPPAAAQPAAAAPAAEANLTQMGKVGDISPDTGTSATLAVVFLPGDSRELASEELAGFELFKGIPAKTIEGSIIKRHKINDQPPIWLRKYSPGEVICQEGEYGSTAFFITKGEVFIGISKQREAAPQPGFFARLFGKKTIDDDDVVAPAHPNQMVPTDAPVALPYDQPLGKLKEGDLFGEMSCMSFYPRSATCVAGPDGVEVLEILRSVLDFIRSNAKAGYKERIEKNYRERTLAAATKSIPLLAGLPPEGLEYLKTRIELVTYNPDTSIYEEGDAADALFLVRLGFVKVSKKRLGGEVVLQYLGPGQHFGETGVIGDGKRQAGCTALDHVELIKIKREDFLELVKRFPGIAATVERVRDEQRTTGPVVEADEGQLPLGVLLEKGVMNAQNLLVIDLDKCTRCDECVRACADAHDGVTRLIRDGLRVDNFLLATACRACTDPVCMIGCPVGSIRRSNSLEIRIEDWCIGCGKCAQQCPYGNIHMHPYEKMVKVIVEEDGKKFKRRELAVVNNGKGRAATCDLCESNKEPRCVYACPHGAARRGHPLDLLTQGLGLKH